MHYGAPPPGYFPPHGFPPHLAPNQYPPQLPIGPHGQQRQQTPGQLSPIHQGPVPPGITDLAGDGKATELKPTATVKLPSSTTSPAPQGSAQAGPPPPNDSKPDILSALEPPGVAPSSVQKEKNIAKNGRIIPAVPLSPAVKKIAATNGSAKTTAGPEAKTSPGGSKSLEEANRDARAAVAAAMAKLPVGEKKQVDQVAAIDGASKAIGELKINESSRGTRGARGSRGGLRGGRDHGKRVEVPKADFDFESANAKFNKHDLVKEAIASGSPVDTPGNVINGGDVETGISDGVKGSEPGISIPVGVSYNRSSSFFDDISSETKDRAENKDSGQRMGGREFRNEERQKNLETFGEGSVDGRGGRYRYGRSGRGRGGYGRSRGPRGGSRGNGRGRQNSTTVEG